MKQPERRCPTGGERNAANGGATAETGSRYDGCRGCRAPEGLWHKKHSSKRRLSSSAGLIALRTDESRQPTVGKQGEYAAECTIYHYRKTTITLWK